MRNRNDEKKVKSDIAFITQTKYIYVVIQMS